MRNHWSQQSTTAGAANDPSVQKRDGDGTKMTGDMSGSSKYANTEGAIMPGSVIGVIGGGQLARMFAQAARSMGYKIVIADPDPDCPAAGPADRVVAARLDDPDAVAVIAEECNVVTYEFENIAPAVLERLSRHVPVYPSVDVLKICQNRIFEKSYLSRIGVPTAAWREVRQERDIVEAIETLGLPVILKTAVLGYDGKGQAVIRTMDDIQSAYERFAGMPLIVEQFVPFEREISVMVARNRHGETVTFPVAENVHERNILATSLVPARIPEQVATAARRLAVNIADHFPLVGILGVEMFVLADGSLAVNELAPRPHNSGHYTLDACVVSQFEQHVRAVCGLPLGATDLLCPVIMVNIMGEDFPLNIDAVLAMNNKLKLHLYDKREARPHRKMGHLNILGNSAEELLREAEAAKQTIRDTRTIRE